ARGPRALVDRQAARRADGLVPAAGHGGRDCPRGYASLERGVLLMPLDIRVPIGAMLGLMGALLAGYGLLGDQAIYARSLDLNVNLIWGSVLMAAAAILLV